MVFVSILTGFLKQSQRFYKKYYKDQFYGYYILFCKLEDVPVVTSD